MKTKATKKAAGRISRPVERAKPWGLRVWFGRTRGMARPHTHQDLEFNCVTQGRLSYFIAGRVVTVQAGHLAVIWGAMPHQTISFSDDLKMGWGTTSLGNTLLGQLPGRFVEQLLGQGLAISPLPCETDWPMFQRWERDLHKATTARRELVQREMELRLLRLAIDVLDVKSTNTSASKFRRAASPEASPDTQPSNARGFEFVQRMAAYIAAHYTESLQLDDITSQVPLHPNYAMTLFRQHTHMTLNTYLTRQRVAHAQRLLATTDNTVLSIALESGFGSPSRFFEAFKQHANCSPRAYRKQLAGS